MLEDDHEDMRRLMSELSCVPSSISDMQFNEIDKFTLHTITKRFKRFKVIFVILINSTLCQKSHCMRLDLTLSKTDFRKVSDHYPSSSALRGHVNRSAYISVHL